MQLVLLFILGVTNLDQASAASAHSQHSVCSCEFNVPLLVTSSWLSEHSMQQCARRCSDAV